MKTKLIVSLWLGLLASQNVWSLTDIEAKVDVGRNEIKSIIQGTENCGTKAIGPIYHKFFSQLLSFKDRLDDKKTTIDRKALEIRGYCSVLLPWQKIQELKVSRGKEIAAVFPAVYATRKLVFDQAELAEKDLFEECGKVNSNSKYKINDVQKAVNNNFIQYADVTNRADLRLRLLTYQVPTCKKEESIKNAPKSNKWKKPAHQGDSAEEPTSGAQGVS